MERRIEETWPLAEQVLLQSQSSSPFLAGGAHARSAGPTPTAPPTVSGTAAAGDRLEAGSGTWTSSTPAAYAYQWHRCDAAGAHCSSGRSATAPGVRAFGTRRRQDGRPYRHGDRPGRIDGCVREPRRSDRRREAAARLDGAAADHRPARPGQAAPGDGRRLEPRAGEGHLRVAALQPERPHLHGDRRRDGGVLHGRFGRRRPRARRARAGELRTTKQSALSTATIAAIGGDIVGPVHTAAPAVTGIAAQLEQLTASPGLWTGVGSIAYSYQWYRCDAAGRPLLLGPRRDEDHLPPRPEGRR